MAMYKPYNQSSPKDIIPKKSMLFQLPNKKLSSPPAVKIILSESGTMECHPPEPSYKPISMKNPLASPSIHPVYN
jgi:hypothetical protein